MKNEIPQHHMSVTVGLDTAQSGEIGRTWYEFLRGVLRASDEIDARRVARGAEAGKANAVASDKEATA